jgi:hypothetical protein
MKIIARKIITYTALNLVIPLPFATHVFAAQDKTATSITAKPALVAPKIDNKMALTKHKLSVETQKQIVYEAKDAVLEVQKALVELDKKDAKAALAAIKVASDNLNIVLKNNPKMSAIPIDIHVNITDFEGDNNKISKAIADANKLLSNGQLQAARQIFAVLASEMRTTTISLPFSVLPSAVKEAEKLVNAGKMNDAATVLSDALNMLVETVDVMPLPILRAEGSLTQASIVEHTQDLSKEKIRETVLGLTDNAKTQLKQAELLGYGGKEDYQVLYKAIDEIKDTIASEKSAATWDNIKKKLTELKNKLMPAKK